MNQLLLPYNPTSKEKVRREEAKARIKELQVKIDYHYQCLEKAKALQLKWKKRYEKYDRLLAETDGRLKVIPLKDEKKKRAKPVHNYTESELRTIAKALGIDLEKI